MRLYVLAALSGALYVIGMFMIGFAAERLMELEVGAARFLAAHTPTRRELPRVVQIARRLRRGEALYEAVD